jgi:stage II sporulation protein D
VLATAATLDLIVQPLDPVTGVLSIPFRDTKSAFQKYRGSMRLKVTPTGIDAINIVPLESYVRGVVPSEMSTRWPIEALKAGAVAARSYGVSHIKTDRDWDVMPTAANQNYGGYSHEATSTDLAVSATANEVLTYSGVVISALYNTCSGGYTESSEYAFVTALGGLGNPVPYLVGQPDVDANGVAYDVNCPSFSWQTGAFSMDELSRIMSLNPATDVGQITNITYWRGVSGRVYKIYLEGTSGARYMSGARFKTTFNLYRPTGGQVKSNMFYLTPVP